MTFRAAFYKGTRPGIQGIYSRGVRLWEGGKYSHMELIFSDGVSASASFVDKGVRFKEIEYSPENWDIIELPAHLEANARKWFEDHEGEEYDLLGNVRFIIGLVQEEKSAWFCSEAAAAALGFDEAWRFEPNVLYSTLVHLIRIQYNDAPTHPIGINFDEKLYLRTAGTAPQHSDCSSGKTSI